MQPQAGSVSKVECAATFRSGGVSRITLYRHLSPLSVSALLHILPVNSRVTIQQGMRCLFTPLAVGVEKPRTSFARGDVAFLASGGLLCIFLQQARSDRPLNPLGNVADNVELFETSKPGDTIRISLVEPPSSP